MVFRFLLALNVLALVGVGSASAQNTATPVITGYLSTSGCPSAALTPCFVQYGAGGASTVTIGAPLGAQTAAASVAVTCNSGCSGGASLADEAPYNVGTTPFTPVGGFFQITPTSGPLTNGQGGWAQMTSNRALHTNLRTAAGVEIGVAAAPVQVSLANTATNATPVNDNLAQVNGVTVSTGTGAVGTGSARVAVGTDTATIAGSAPGTAGTASANVVTVQGVASMTKLLVTPDSVALPANQSVNEAQINGVTPLMGNGVSGTGSQRVNIASDNTPFSVKIDQTTPGTTNAVQTLTGSVTTALSSSAITNPTSTLTMTSATTAYTAGQLIASNATAGSVVVPSFAIANSAGGAILPRLRLSINDATGTAWGAASIQVDLWSAAPTWTNGDRAAWSPATGVAGHLGSYTCTMSAEYGDGAFAECSSVVGNAAMPKLASGTSVFWSLKATTGSGVTGASKVWTLTAEELN